MNYEQLVEYVHSHLKFGIRPGLSRMNTLLAYLGNPQKGMKFIHVAGTNGKGSTATAIANVLLCAGYNTGLYTSPYVVHFLERIQINSAPAEEEAFAQAMSDIAPYADTMCASGEEITEFELITAAAFLCYKRSGCDIVVLEVGLGGRLDATNVIENPLIEVITSLSLDHTAILGDTIEKIAYEKCGIIKNNTAVICAPCQPDGAMSVIEATVRERRCRLIIPMMSEMKLLSSDIFGTDFSYKGNDYRINMAGEHQVKNMVSVIEASRLMSISGFDVTEKNIYEGIANTSLPARVEVLSNKPLVILDGSHNPDGINALCKAIDSFLSDKKLIVIIGMMADKDVDKCIALLGVRAYRIICVTPENPRSISAGNLSEKASAYCDNVINTQKLTDVYPGIIKTLTEDEALLISGSLYLAGEVKQIDLRGIL